MNEEDWMEAVDEPFSRVQDAIIRVFLWVTFMPFLFQ